MHPLTTVSTLTDGLASLGVTKGSTLLVHCSLSSFEKVQGGSQALRDALMACVGEAGTLVMPTLTNGRFDPSEWQNPPAPPEDWDRIRFETPLFHPQKTPTDHTMSRVYELFRTWPDVVRTNHPHTSMAAWGAHRDRITKEHRLEERLGNSSPLGALYELDADVLFLGTTYATNTCFHLAEYRRANPPVREFRIVQEVGGEKKLVKYDDVDTDSSVFEEIGEDFEKSSEINSGFIGSSNCKLFSLRLAVDFAVNWFEGRG